MHIHLKCFYVDSVPETSEAYGDLLGIERLCFTPVCVSLMEEHKLSVGQNRVLRAFGPKREEGTEGSSKLFYCVPLL
jgi:hypothetical protein